MWLWCHDVGFEVEVCATQSGPGSQANPWVVWNLARSMAAKGGGTGASLGMDRTGSQLRAVSWSQLSTAIAVVLKKSP
jgi:hypothetical protein